VRVYLTAEHDADVMPHFSDHQPPIVDDCSHKRNVRASFIPPGHASIPISTRPIRTHPSRVRTGAYPANPDSEYGWEKFVLRAPHLSSLPAMTAWMSRCALVSQNSSGQKALDGRTRKRPLPGPRGFYAAGSRKRQKAAKLRMGDGEQTRSFCSSMNARRLHTAVA